MWGSTSGFWLTITRFRWGSGLVDVAVELVALELELADAVLHHVTDADDAGQLSVGDHRDVPDAVLGHRLHEVGEAVVARAGAHVGGHDLADGRLEDVRVGVQTAYDVALADDPRDPLAVVADHERADVVLGEEGDQLAHRGVRTDGHHLVARLGLDHVVDLHRPTVAKFSRGREVPDARAGCSPIPDPGAARRGRCRRRSSRGTTAPRRGGGRWWRARCRPRDRRCRRAR